MFDDPPSSIVRSSLAVAAAPGSGERDMSQERSSGTDPNKFALVLNGGSSSFKFCVFRRLDDAVEWQLEARGQISGIGTSPKLAAREAAGASIADAALPPSVGDAGAALDVVATWLRNRHRGARVLGVGHRVVHGGTRYTQPCLVTPDVILDLRELVPLAPLHQPHNIDAIEAVAARMPRVPQVACFDTAFHRTLPAV